MPLLSLPKIFSLLNSPMFLYCNRKKKKNKDFRIPLLVCVILRQIFWSFIFTKSLKTIKSINYIIAVIKKTLNFSKISLSIHLAHDFYWCYSCSKIPFQNFQIQNNMFLYSTNIDGWMLGSFWMSWVALRISLWMCNQEVLRIPWIPMETYTPKGLPMFIQSRNPWALTERRRCA